MYTVSNLENILSDRSESHKTTSYVGQNISAPRGIRMMISGPTDRIIINITRRVYCVCHNNC